MLTQLIGDFLRRDFVGRDNSQLLQTGGGSLPSFHGSLYQHGYGGIATVFGRLARMAMPVVRLLMPHVVSGIGELASTIAASTVGGKKRKLKRVLHKHGLQVADDVIKKLKSKYEQADAEASNDDEQSDVMQIGSCAARKRLS